MNLDTLRQLTEPPPPFTPGEALFWDDPHISQQMLAAHLDPSTPAASRHPDTIDATATWIMDTLGLRRGDTLLDLGCGPGLYAQRFAERGLRVTGVDYSRRSIEYARQQAATRGLALNYRYQDYLTLDDTNRYAAALLIYGDLCVLSPERRDSLLARVHAALRPGGRFVFDVTTRTLRARHGLRNGWHVQPDGGFWKPGPHLVLEQGFDYPDQSVYLDQYVIIEPGERISVYRNWFLDYSLETITAAVEAQGFAVAWLGGDLVGAPYADDSEWIGIVADKI